MEIDYKYLHDALDRLEHTSTVAAFHYKFQVIQRLLAFLHPEIPESYFASRFILGLQVDFQNFLIKFKPVTVFAAYKLALIYEESIYLDYFPEVDELLEENCIVDITLDVHSVEDVLAEEACFSEQLMQNEELFVENILEANVLEVCISDDEVQVEKCGSNINSMVGSSPNPVEKDTVVTLELSSRNVYQNQDNSMEKEAVGILESGMPPALLHHLQAQQVFDEISQRTIYVALKGEYRCSRIMCIQSVVNDEYGVTFTLCFDPGIFSNTGIHLKLKYFDQRRSDKSVTVISLVIFSNKDINDREWKSFLCVDDTAEDTEGVTHYHFFSDTEFSWEHGPLAILRQNDSGWRYMNFSPYNSFEVYDFLTSSSPNANCEEVVDIASLDIGHFHWVPDALDLHGQIVNIKGAQLADIRILLCLMCQVPTIHNLHSSSKGSFDLIPVEIAGVYSPISTVFEGQTFNASFCMVRSLDKVLVHHSASVLDIMGVIDLSAILWYIRKLSCVSPSKHPTVQNSPRISEYLDFQPCKISDKSSSCKDTLTTRSWCLFQLVLHGVVTGTMGQDEGGVDWSTHGGHVSLDAIFYFDPGIIVFVIWSRFLANGEASIDTGIIQNGITSLVQSSTASYNSSIRIGPPQPFMHGSILQSIFPFSLNLRLIWYSLPFHCLSGVIHHLTECCVPCFLLSNAAVIYIITASKWNFRKIEDRRNSCVGSGTYCHIIQIFHLEYTSVTLWLLLSFWNAEEWIDCLTLQSDRGLFFALLALKSCMSVVEALIRANSCLECDNMGSVASIEIWASWCYASRLSVIVWEPGGQTKVWDLPWSSQCLFLGGNADKGCGWPYFNVFDPGIVCTRPHSFAVLWCIVLSEISIGRGMRMSKSMILMLVSIFSIQTTEVLTSLLFFWHNSLPYTNRSTLKNLAAFEAQTVVWNLSTINVVSKLWPARPYKWKAYSEECSLGCHDRSYNITFRRYIFSFAPDITWILVPEMEDFTTQMQWMLVVNANAYMIFCLLMEEKVPTDSPPRQCSYGRMSNIKTGGGTLLGFLWRIAWLGSKESLYPQRCSVYSPSDTLLNLLRHIAWHSHLTTYISGWAILADHSFFQIPHTSVAFSHPYSKYSHGAENCMLAVDICFPLTIPSVLKGVFCQFPHKVEQDCDLCPHSAKANALYRPVYVPSIMVFFWQDSWGYDPGICGLSDIYDMITSDERVQVYQLMHIYVHIFAAIDP